VDDGTQGRHPRRVATALALPDGANAFERQMLLAVLAISPNLCTRSAYWSDALSWCSFARERGFDPARPPRGSVEAFVEWMRLNGEASTTRTRRISAMSSVYHRLCRAIDEEAPPLVERNPFSIENGPAREVAIPERPTSLPDADTVHRVLDTCGSDDLGIRDAAIIRILWATGARRISLRSMTFERLHRERGACAFVAEVVGKGRRRKRLRLLICGRAAIALEAWLAIVMARGISSGPIWLGKCGPMTLRDINHLFERRLKLIGAPKGALSPHMLRVGFLTRSRSPIDARQDAAGHQDPKTTAGYDRHAWRGRQAFERMPEVEDVVSEEVSERSADDHEDKP
jgi:site-specific recombinase XerC